LQQGYAQQDMYAKLQESAQTNKKAADMLKMIDSLVPAGPNRAAITNEVIRIGTAEGTLVSGKGFTSTEAAVDAINRAYNQSSATGSPTSKTIDGVALDMEAKAPSYRDMDIQAQQDEAYGKQLTSGILPQGSAISSLTLEDGRSQAVVNLPDGTMKFMGTPATSGDEAIRIASEKIGLGSAAAREKAGISIDVARQKGSIAVDTAEQKAAFKAPVAGSTATAPVPDIGAAIQRMEDIKLRIQTLESK